MSDFLLSCRSVEEGIPTACVKATDVGDIHWTGTETTSDHPGYIEGAIESGLRVAQEVAPGAVAHSRPTSTSPGG
ncbi:FAD-dependent oxidoreductase [Mycolicibacterium septicum]|nr:FAD-dependent oxidoreductase [Mycolicibacterium septicum]